jgi:hypothetical protein
MATSKTEACNLAISHLAISEAIDNVETERSASARVCRRFFPVALEKYQRDFGNTFSIVILPLALVADMRNTEGAEWAFSYRYPSDCSKALRIPSGFRNDNEESRIPYRIIKDATGKLILTDVENATLEYSQMVNDIIKFPSDEVLAFSFLLAFYIAPSLTAGDPFKLGNRAITAYGTHLGQAHANAIGEQQPENYPESPTITARN